jgi:hypothetical protein
MENLKILEIDIDNKIKLLNNTYKSHFFNFKENNDFYTKQIEERYNLNCFDDCQIYSKFNFSNEYLKEIRKNMVIKQILNNNFDKKIKLLSFGCKHILHDDKWLKFTKDNFICDLNEDVAYVYCNSFNNEDLHETNLVEFINKLKDMDYQVDLMDFDKDTDNLDDGYENEDITWLVISIKK